MNVKDLPWALILTDLRDEYLVCHYSFLEKTKSMGDRRTVGE